MSYIFSDRISGLKPSAIREIFKVLQDPSVISFAGGNPNAATFPAEEMAEITAKIYRENAGTALQYGMTEGYPLLRNLIKNRLRDQFGVGREYDDVIITSGAQQAIELTAKAFLNEGDVLICEDPSFIGALNAFRSFNARLVGVPMEEDGISLEKLEETLKKEKRAKLIYVIPNFQNPSGITMSLEKRRGVLALAEKYGVMVLEDNPYGELRYSGDPLPTIKSLDTSGRVVYAGTFSKILSAGMRIGFACAPEEVITRIVVGKQVQDVHSNQLFQMAVAEYLELFDIDAHIERDVIPLYRSNRDLMIECLEAGLDRRVSFTRPDGGLFLWCTMPDGFNGADFCRLLLERSVAAVPGATFMADENGISPSFRLNYSMPTREKIIRGIDILCTAMTEYLR